MEGFLLALIPVVAELIPRVVSAYNAGNVPLARQLMHEALVRQIFDETMRAQDPHKAHGSPKP